MNLNELKDKRGNVNKQMTDLTMKYATSGEKWSNEDNEKFQKMNEDSENLRCTIQRMETVSANDVELKEVKTSLVGREMPKTVETSFVNKDEQELKAFRSYLAFGTNDMSPNELEVLRSLSNASGAVGAYAAPAQTTSEFVKILNNLTGMRQAPVKVFATFGANELPFPTFDDTANTADTTAEESSLDVNVDPTFGQIVFKGYNFDSQIVKISRQLLQDSVIPVEQLINEALAERISKKINNSYTVGNGTTAPEGITVGAGASGVSLPATTLGATATEIVQNIQAIIHSVGVQYRNSPAFGLMFNDNTLLKLKQIVDSTGRQIWQPSLAVGEPDTIGGKKYYVNPDMADIGASAKSIVVGDFSKFYIRDVASVEFLRLNELYAANLQVGFLAHFRTDSKVMNSSAIKYVSHASS